MLTEDITLWHSVSALHLANWFNIQNVRLHRRMKGARGGGGGRRILTEIESVGQ